jgi:hypothetical protein
MRRTTKRMWFAHPAESITACSTLHCSTRKSATGCNRLSSLKWDIMFGMSMRLVWNSTTSSGVCSSVETSE